MATATTTPRLFFLVVGAGLLAIPLAHRLSLTGRASAVMLHTSDERSPSTAAAGATTPSWLSVQADLNSREGCSALVDAVARHTDRLHGVVFTQDARSSSSLTDLAVPEFERLMRLNAKAPWTITVALLPYLLKVRVRTRVLSPHSPTHSVIVQQQAKAAGEPAHVVIPGEHSSSPASAPCDVSFISKCAASEIVRQLRHQHPDVAFHSLSLEGFDLAQPAHSELLADELSLLCCTADAQSRHLVARTLVAHHQQQQQR